MGTPGLLPAAPLVTYNFRVVVGAITMSFTEASGLVRQHEIVAYRHGLSFREGQRIAKFTYEKRAAVVMRKGTLTRGSALLYAWLETKLDIPMSVVLCDAKGRAALSWQIVKAIPVKLSAPAVNAGSSGVAIDTFEVQAAGIFVV